MALRKACGTLNSSLARAVQYSEPGRVQSQQRQCAQSQREHERSSIKQKCLWLAKPLAQTLGYYTRNQFATYRDYGIRLKPLREARGFCAKPREEAILPTNSGPANPQHAPLHNCFGTLPQKGQKRHSSVVQHAFNTSMIRLNFKAVALAKLCTAVGLLKIFDAEAVQQGCDFSRTPPLQHE